MSSKALPCKGEGGFQRPRRSLFKAVVLAEDMRQRVQSD